MTSAMTYLCSELSFPCVRGCTKRLRTRERKQRNEDKKNYRIKIRREMQKDRYNTKNKKERMEGKRKR
jgi:hypothetical protein